MFFDRVFMTYLNEEKIQMIDIKTQTLYSNMAASSETIKEMPVEAQKIANNDVEVITTVIVRLGRRFDENF